MITPTEADELQARAVALVAAFLRGDEPAAEALIGPDSYALLGVLLGMFVDITAGLVGRNRLTAGVDHWLAERLARLSEAA